MAKSMRAFPDNYRPSSYCRSCGRDFSGDRNFDRHRVGDHELDYPEHPNGRRCATVEEMRAKGLRPMTDEEMQADIHHRHQVGSGVEMWFAPAETARARRSLSGVRDAP